MTMIAGTAGLTAAEIAAAAAMAAEAAAAASAAGGTAAAGAGALGAGAGALEAGAGAGALGAAEMAAPVAVEGAAVSPEVAGMGLNEAMGPAQGMMQGDMGAMVQQPMEDIQGLMPDWQASMENIGQGNVGAELANIGEGVSLPGMPEQPNPMEMLGLGGGGSPAPVEVAETPAMPAQTYTPSAEKHLSDIDWGGMGQGLDAQHAEVSGSGKTPEPTDWRGRLKTAQQALKMAGMLTTNKKDKQTLSLIEMGAGMGAANDAESTMKAMNGPLGEISKATQESEKRLSDVPEQAPPSVQPFMPQSKKMSLPPTSLGGAGSGLSMEQRLRLIRGY